MGGPPYIIISFSIFWRVHFLQMKKKAKVLVKHKNTSRSDSKWPKSGRTRLLYLPWKMGSIWKARNISLQTKIWLFNVKTILLYGAETWKTTKSLLHKLQIFINNCLRHILNFRWPEKISNKDLWLKTNQPPSWGRIEKEKMDVDRAHTDEAETQHR